MALHLEFLFQHNHSDLLLLKQVWYSLSTRLVAALAALPPPRQAARHTPFHVAMQHVRRSRTNDRLWFLAAHYGARTFAHSLTGTDALR